MASRKERQRILSGGLNLLPPGDKIPEQDAILLDNWRVDQSGCLRSRQGSAYEAGPVGSGIFHTLRRSGNERYAGIGEALYHGPTLGSEVTDGFDGEPLGIAFYQGSAWVMNRDKRVRVQGNTATNWGIAAPVAAPVAAAGAVGPISGAVTYFVSFVNVDGHDSNPSPSDTVEVEDQNVDLTSIPVSADDQVTGRRIYRIGGGLDMALLVGELFDNTATTFTDTMGNADAQNLGAEMPVNRQLPPAARGVVGPYLGKLIAFSSADHPARMWWTSAAHPWYFPGADELTGNWEDVGGDDDPLFAATDHKRLLILYKRRSIWRLSGDPVNASPERTNANLGLVGPLAVVNAGAVDYLMGPEGVYRFNGDFEEKISGPVDPIFKGDYARVADEEYIPPVDRVNITSSVLELINDRLYVSYPEAGESLPNITLVYHIESGRWSRMTLNAAGPAPSVMHYEGAGAYLMAGVTDEGAGYLYRLEQGGFTDPLGSVWVAWQSRYLDQGLPDNLKRYCDLEIEFQTGNEAEEPSTLSVYTVYDNGRKESVGTISSASRTTAILPLGEARAKNVAVRIEGDAASPCIIYGTYLHWYAEERTAKTYDSGVLGGERVRQVDMVELVLTGEGQEITRSLASDLPGGTLEERDAVEFDAPDGRGTSRARLASIVEGRNLRLRLGSDTAFQLHAARIRQREIGEYIAEGEYWESPEFSVAPGRDGELKDLLLDYDASNAGGELLIYSDQPGGELALRRTIDLPERGTRATVAFPLEDDGLPYGTMFKARINPPSNGVVRLHGRAQFRVRMIGLSFDGGDGERWETQPVDLVGGIGEFREVSLIAQTGGPMVFEMLTELANGWAVRSIYEFDTDGERLPIDFRVPGNTKGRLQRFRVTGDHTCRLFSVRVYGRRLGGNPSAWAWLNVPMETTPDEWSQLQIPMHQTPAEFTWLDLPLDAIE